MLITLLAVAAQLCFALGTLLLMGGGISALVVLLVKLSAKELEERAKAWQAAADELGLRVTRRAERMEGVLRGRQVTLVRRVVGSGDNRRVYGDVVVSGLPGELALEHEGFRLFGKPPDQRCGDEAFDDKVIIGGDEAAVAWLHAPFRAAWLELCARRRLSVRKGELTLRSDLPRRHDQVRARFEEALALVEALTPEEPLRDRVLCTAREDPSPGARAVALRLAGRHFPGPDVKALAEALLDAPEAEVRLAAASALGRPEVMLDAALHRDVPLPVTLAALEELGRDPARVPALLHAATRRDDVRIWRAVLRAARAHPGPDVARALCAFAEAVLRPETWVDATAFGRQRGVTLVVLDLLRDHAGPDAQPTLLRLLQAPEPKVQRHAVWALGRCGTVDAVVPLREAAEASPLIGGLRADAELAVQQIQGRSTGEVGGLAIADPAPEVGALSEVADRGRLALAREQQRGRGRQGH